jgi:hypothetical protein
MKKIITLLMAASLIFAFAGIAAAADCVNCAPGTINRACSGEQGACVSEIFSVEDEDISTNDNYCDTSKLPRRVMFEVCDCEDEFKIGDTVDISLEILVNGQTAASSDHGAYWAENVNSIAVNPFVDQPAACEGSLTEQYGFKYDDDSAGDGWHFDYKYYDYDNNNRATNGSPLTTHADDFDCDDIEDYQRVTVITPDATTINANCLAHGFKIPLDFNGEGTWVIDIPDMRFDNSIIQAGDIVSVRICLAKAVPATSIDTPCYNADPAVNFYKVDTGNL